MNAKEYYEGKAWGNPHWDRRTTFQFDKSEMFDFAEHYHQAKLKSASPNEVCDNCPHSLCVCKSLRR